MPAAANQRAKCGACGAIGFSYEGRNPRLLERALPLIDYIEVTPEAFAEHRDGQLCLDREVVAELKAIGDDARIVVHGVGLSIGSHDAWSPTYFPLLDRFLEQVDVAWHSEHLAYTQVDGEHLGIMLALPRTEEALDLVSERVQAIQRRYALPFLLEHVVHVLPDAAGDYSEAGFLNALTARTGCGLIFDPYNLQCDAHNLGLDIDRFLQELDFDAVREMHLACGVEHNGFQLDVHSQVPRASTLAIGQRIAQKIARPDLAIIFEFMDEALPQLGENAVIDELAHLRHVFGIAP